MATSGAERNRWSNTQYQQATPLDCHGPNRDSGSPAAACQGRPPDTPGGKRSLNQNGRRCKEMDSKPMQMQMALKDNEARKKRLMRYQLEMQKMREKGGSKNVTGKKWD